MVEPAATKNDGDPDLAAAPVIRQRKVRWRFDSKWDTGVVLSLIGLVLSLVVAFYQLWGFAWGPQPGIVPPDLVAFHCSRADDVPATELAGMPADRRARLDRPSDPIECEPDSYMFLRATSVALTNLGYPDYGTIVQSEWASVHFGGKRTVLLYWEFFNNVTTSGSSADIAQPQVVPGASAFARETDYYPRDFACSGATCDVRRDYLTWRDFETLMLDPTLQVSVEFSARFRDRFDRTVTQSCKLFVGDEDRKDVADLQMMKTNLRQLVCT